MKKTKQQKELEFKARKYLEALTGAKLGKTQFCHDESVRFAISLDMLQVALVNLARNLKRSARNYPLGAGSYMHQWNVGNNIDRVISIIEKVNIGGKSTISVTDYTVRRTRMQKALEGVYCG